MAETINVPEAVIIALQKHYRALEDQLGSLVHTAEQAREKLEREQTTLQINVDDFVAIGKFLGQHNGDAEDWEDVTEAILDEHGLWDDVTEAAMSERGAESPADESEGA